jgi:unsaturated rhamnogalacturonyl hydrolase
MKKNIFISILSFFSVIILATVILAFSNNDPQTAREKKSEEKIVGLDYYFNHEMKKGKDGKEFQYHYIWEDTTNSGYSELGKIIKGLGAEITSVKEKPTSEILDKLSIYLIVDPDIPAENPHPNYIEDDDIKNIAKWVKGGGILILFANDKGNCEFKHLNRLSEKFGIHFNEDSKNRVTGNNFDVGKFNKFPDQPIFKNVKQIYLKEISTLKLSGNAKPILEHKSDVIMASSDFGKGFVFAVGDPWFYNEYIDNRNLPDGFENYKAAKNLFRWLLAKSKDIKLKQ